MSYTDTRFTVSSFTVENGSKRYTVFEDTVAIFESGSEQEARDYADALTRNLARLSR